MRREPGWETFEAHVNNLLLLDSTVASGSQYHDPGDGVDRSHPSETDMAVMVDAKYTVGRSFSISAKLLRQYVERAAMGGKRFVLAVRMTDPKDVISSHDYAVLPLDDYAELLSAYRTLEHQDREAGRL